MLPSQPLIYGTAWKRDRTKDLVIAAIRVGFRSFDTANQLEHYREDLVGEGIRQSIEEGLISREDIYLQSKFSPYDNGGEQSRRTYSDLSAIADHVSASVKQSLFHLRHSRSNDSSAASYVDSLVLHTTLETFTETMTAWYVLEDFVPVHIHSLGISNVTQARLQSFYEAATVKPSCVQNPLGPGHHFDAAVRSFCAERFIQYQCFSILKRGSVLLQTNIVTGTAEHMQITKESALIVLMVICGIATVITGPHDVAEMRMDVESLCRALRWAQAESNTTALAYMRQELQSALSTPTQAT